MGVYSLHEFVGKLGEAQAAVSAVPTTGVTAASQLVKRNILAITPGRLRGVGKRGGKLGVRYKIVNRGPEAESFIKATGPFQLIERDTKAHGIPRDRTRGRTRYAVFGDGVYSHVDHPGTQGKHPFERGTTASFPGIRKIFQDENYEALRRVF